MTPMRRGLVIALAQVALVTGVAGALWYDRVTLPRVWVLTTGVDPYLPIRGRYVELRLVVDTDAPGRDPTQTDGVTYGFGRLSVEDGQLRVPVFETESETAWPGPDRRYLQQVETGAGRVWTLAEPVAFFLAEDAPDPTRLKPGEALWAEVTVPRRGPPRPIRLEVRQRSG